MGNARLGRKVSSATRKKISLALKGGKGRPYPCSDEAKNKISLSLMGHKTSKETREKISRSVHRLMTEEHKQEMRKKAIALGWPKEARRKSEEFNKNFVFTKKMRKKNKRNP